MGEPEIDRGRRSRVGARAGPVRRSGGSTEGGGPVDGGGAPAGPRLPAARPARVGQAGRGPGPGRRPALPAGRVRRVQHLSAGPGRNPPRPGGGGADRRRRSTSTRRGSIVTRAQRRPLESSRQVLVVTDVHLAVKAAPALLKTVEEPPPVDRVHPGGRRPPADPGHHRQPVRAGPVRPGSRCRGGRLAGGPRASNAATPSRWPGLRGDASTGPACWSATPASQPVRSSGGRCPSRLDGTGAAAAAVSIELLASADEALGPVARTARRRSWPPWPSRPS